MMMLNFSGLKCPLPAIMGVINTSPDSFFRPALNKESALRQAETMVSEGVAIIDVGGQATNPQINLENSTPSLNQELDRVLPVIEAIADRFEVLISVDTIQPVVMREAVAVGAGMINDQCALSEPGALEAAAKLNVPVCLMHRFNPSRIPKHKSLEPVLFEVLQDLSRTVARCEEAGLLRQNLIIDPGFGQGHFRKSIEENYYLLANLQRFTTLGLPLLVGWSRKTMIGDILKLPADDCLSGSLAAALIAAMQGTAVIRTHDVKETAQAIKIFQATRRYKDFH